MQVVLDQEIFVFPLHTVLFPDGMLPLKVFEQRYIEMTKACLRDDRPFGVCRIKEGHEVGAAALPESVGCLATIAQWDMPHPGLFHLVARGGQRFRILQARVAPNDLISARIELIPPDDVQDKVDEVCRGILQAVIERVGAERFPVPLKLDDAAWVGYRLAELLPLEPAAKQQMLETRDPQVRLARLRAEITRQGLAA
ncbi:MAG: peptidase S16 [Betaproteobacteria bacterium]|nr:peptidase S16 [Betaproteobacteria bacterium]